MEHFMANKLDKQYQHLLQDILEYGLISKTGQELELKVYLVTLFITI
jgi:hypothetical protein